MAVQVKDPSKGVFRGFINRDKNKKQPTITGKIALANQRDERGFSLWGHTSEKTGAVVLSGSVKGSGQEQIAERIAGNDRQDKDADDMIAVLSKDGAKALQLKPNDMVLFVNKQKQENPKQPDYYGYWRPGNSEELQRLSGWVDTDRNGNAMISGSVQKYEQRQDQSQGHADSQGHEPAAESHRRDAPDHDEDEQEEGHSQTM
jgi:hypothetical protein